MIAGLHILTRLEASAAAHRSRCRASILSLIGAGGCIAAMLLLGTGCSRPTLADHPPPGHRVLGPAEAAELAARLANDECARLYQKRRPFSPSQHKVILRDSRYEWGGLDPGAPGGYSALVTFNPDGTNPKVEVYFSTDILMVR